MSLWFCIAVIISIILQDKKKKKHAANSPWFKDLSQLYVETLHS